MDTILKMVHELGIPWTLNFICIWYYHTFMVKMQKTMDENTKSMEAIKESLDDLSNNLYRSNPDAKRNLGLGKKTGS